MGANRPLQYHDVKEAVVWERSHLLRASMHLFMLLSLTTRRTRIRRGSLPVTPVVLSWWGMVTCHGCSAGRVSRAEDVAQTQLNHRKSVLPDASAGKRVEKGKNTCD